MSKSTLLKALVLVSLVFSGLSSAADGKKVMWRLAETWGPNFPVFGDSSKNMARLVKEMSNGRFIIRIDSANKHKSALGIFDFVKSGQYQMGHSASYYWKGKDFNTMFFTTVPFGMTTAEQNAWFYHGGGMELMKSVYDKYGIMSFPGGNTGNQMGGWFRKEINSAADFNGLKFRMPGLGGKVLGKLGASVQNIPGGELYQALSSGALDGLEWVGPFADERAGFQEVAKIYYTAGFHEPGSGLTASVNLDVFNDLTPAQQKIIEYASMATTHTGLAETLANNGAALSRLQQQGVKTMQFPDDVWDAFGAASKEVMDENMDDTLFADIRTSFESSLSASAEWLSKSDAYYVEQRQRVLGKM